MRPHFLPRAIVAMLLVLAMTGGAWAQGNPTGTVAGRVSGQDGAALPGVTVTATSPNLQGPRTVVTNEVGDYIIPFLPPGEYTLTYELQGFQGANQKTLVTGAATVPVDAKLQVGGVNEAITVTGAVTDAFTPGVSASTTLKQQLVNDMEFARQHVGLGHRQTGALAGEQRDARGRVAHERNPAPRPAIQPDLADDIEIQIIDIVEGGEDLRAFPAHVGEVPPHYCLPRRCITDLVRMFGTEHEQKQRAVPAQRNPSHGPAGVTVGHIDELIARPVAVNHPRRD